MWIAIAGFVKDFQELIVGALGFSGVIWTLWHTARLTREQHAAEIAHQAATVKVALLAELRRNAESFRKNLEMIDQLSGDDGVIVPRSPITQIYDSLLDRIGLLDRSEAQKVFEAYSHIKLVPRSLQLALSLELLRSQVNREAYQAVTALLRDDQYIFATPGVVAALRTGVQNALNRIDDAITAIS